LVVPFHAVTQMEDIGRVIQRLPALSQVGFNGEGARLYPCADLMPQEPAIDEAQGGIRLEVDHEVMVKVGRLIPAHAQDAAAPGLSQSRPPERGGTRGGPGRERDAGGEASPE